MDRDVILLIVGGIIGFVSSLITMILSYILDNKRTQRLWQREDNLRKDEVRNRNLEMARDFHMANLDEIQRWMEDISANKTSSKKLIFDKATKRLIVVSPNDPRADENLEFTAQEATRFGADVVELKPKKE